jgi:double zinc ribbon protein
LSGAVLLVALLVVVATALSVPIVRRRNITPLASQQPAEGSLVADNSVQSAVAEIELDHAMGKLSDADYATLRSRYAPDSPQATGPDRRPSEPVPATLIAATPVGVPTGFVGALDDLAENLVNDARATRIACPVCGPRPEPESRFCSSCGRFLRPCPRCGHTALQPGARFCAHCAAVLA